MPFGKWRDFEHCVREFMKQGKDEDSAKRICGTLEAHLGKESFSWTGSIAPYERNLIKGKALHPIKTVHPQEWPAVRVYLEEELKRATHTLSGKPLLLDHVYPVDGKVLGAEYEDGAIEYIAEVNDERVLEWIKDGSIRHCSVEYDWSSLEKANGVAPKGIQFTGLALLKDFEPGDPGTTVEWWESIVKRLKEARTEGKATERNGETERDRLKQAQQGRADRYGIRPKEGGHLTKPEEYKDVPEDQFADPVNYRYPVDAEHVRAALSYFNQPDNRKDYSHEEALKVMTKIASAALKNGVEVSWQPEDSLYRDLPEELKQQLSGYEAQSRKESKHWRKEQKPTVQDVKRLGEAVIDPSAELKIPEGYVRKDAIAEELKKTVFERVPLHWGYGPYEQNRRIKAFIKRLEGGCA